MQIPVESSSLQADVVIIGAGPTGLMAAQALAALGVNVVVVERRRPGDIYGNADGLQPRTLEIWQSYGFLEGFLPKAIAVHALVTYDKQGGNGIKRGTPCRNIVVDCRYPYELAVGIQIIEGTLRAQVERHGGQILQPAQPVDITFNAQDNGHKGGVVVTIQHLPKDEKESTKITNIQAKYAIGADGAHSWMRQQLGVTLEGEKTEYVWGVIDVCMHTDFPDARLKCIIQSSQGAMIIIPREEDKLRFYVQCSPKDRISELNEDIKNKLLQRISDGLRPYKITFTQIFWYTIFSVPQKVASKFRVGPIFLAGDACHTHSPKAGQGANISMGDAHNLAWKLAWVLRGWSDDSLLDTYEIERRTLAIQLIEFDKAISASLNGCEASRYSSMLHEQNLFTSGVGIRYRSQLMVEANNREVSLSDTFSLEIGTRLPPMNIVRFADWHPMDIQDLAASDGLFKIIIFSGDLQGDIESKGLREFAEHLQLSADKKQGSILFKQFTMFTVVTEYKESDIWSFIPPFLRNWRRIFTDRDSNINTEGNQNGVAKQRGTVVVRPDGYISAILEVSGRSAAFLCEYLKHL